MPLILPENTGKGGGKTLWTELTRTNNVVIQQPILWMTQWKNKCAFRIITTDAIRYVIAKSYEWDEIISLLPQCDAIVAKLHRDKRYHEDLWTEMKAAIEQGNKHWSKNISLPSSQLQKATQNSTQTNTQNKQPLQIPPRQQNEQPQHSSQNAPSLALPKEKPAEKQISVITDEDIRDYYNVQNPGINVSSLSLSQDQDKENVVIAEMAHKLFLIDDANELRAEKAKLRPEYQKVLYPIINQRLLELQRQAYESASMKELHEEMRKIELANDREAQLRKSIFLPIIRDLITSRYRQKYRRCESARELWGWKVQMLEEGTDFEKDALLAELNENLVYRFITWLSGETELSTLDEVANDIRAVQKRLGDKSDQRELMCLALIGVRQKEVLEDIARRAALPPPLPSISAEAAQPAQRPAPSFLQQILEGKSLKPAAVPLYVRSEGLLSKKKNLVPEIEQLIPEKWKGKTGVYDFKTLDHDDIDKILLDVVSKGDQKRFGAAVCFPGKQLSDFKVYHFSVTEARHFGEFIKAISEWILKFQRIRYGSIPNIHNADDAPVNLILCLPRDIPDDLKSTLETHRFKVNERSEWILELPKVASQDVPSDSQSQQMGLSLLWKFSIAPKIKLLE